jgi:hypothetical protein
VIHACTYVSLDGGFMADLIEIVRRDTRLQRRSRDVEYLTCEPADGAHRLLGLLVQDVDLRPVQAQLTHRHTSLGIVRMGYRRRDRSSRRERIDGSDGAGEGICREGIEKSRGGGALVDGFVLALCHRSLSAFMNDYKRRS